MHRAKSFKKRTQGSGVPKGPRWNLSDVPKPIVPLIVKHLKTVEKCCRKEAALEKVTWQKDNIFKATLTTFYDGTKTFQKVVGEEQQLQIHNEKFQEKITLLQAEVLEARTEVESTINEAKQLLLKHRSSVAVYENKWLNNDMQIDVNDPFDVSEEQERKKAIRQVAEATQSIHTKYSETFERWKTFQVEKKAKKETAVKEQKVLTEILTEECQHKLPMQQQIENVRSMLTKINILELGRKFDEQKKQKKNSAGKNEHRKRTPRDKKSKSGGRSSSSSSNKTRTTRSSSSNSTHSTRSESTNGTKSRHKTVRFQGENDHKRKRSSTSRKGRSTKFKSVKNRPPTPRYAPNNGQ